MNPRPVLLHLVTWVEANTASPVIDSGLRRDKVWWVEQGDTGAARLFWVQLYETRPGRWRFRNGHSHSPTARWRRHDAGTWGGVRPFEITLHKDEVGAEVFPLIYQACTQLDSRLPSELFESESEWSYAASIRSHVATA